MAFITTKKCEECEEKKYEDWSGDKTICFDCQDRLYNRFRELFITQLDGLPHDAQIRRILELIFKLQLEVDKKQNIEQRYS